MIACFPVLLKFCSDSTTADTETVITAFLLHNLLPHQILSWLHYCQVMDKLLVDAPLNQQVLTSSYIHSGQVGGGCLPQLTNVDEPSHSGQVGGMAQSQNILNKSAAEIIRDHPELCSVANVGTLAVKLAVSFGVKF